MKYVESHSGTKNELDISQKNISVWCYLFIAFISIFDMPIGHINSKSTCPSQKSTCPECLGSHLFAPWKRAGFGNFS